MDPAGPAAKPASGDAVHRAILATLADATLAMRRHGGGDTDVGAASFVSPQLYGRNRLFVGRDTNEMDEWCVSPPKNGIKGGPVAAGMI